MDKWTFVMWENSSGKKPVEKWISDLPDPYQKKMLKLVSLVSVFGPRLPFPQNRNLGEGLYELRDLSTGPGYRVYYGVKNHLIIILLIAGDKSSQERDIKTARKRLLDEEI